MRSSFIWNVRKRRLRGSYRCFGTNYRSHLQMSRSSSGQRLKSRKGFTKWNVYDRKRSLSHLLSKSRSGLEERRAMTKIFSHDSSCRGSIFEPDISRIKVQKVSTRSNLAGQKFGEAKYIRAINHVFPDTDTSKLFRKKIGKCIPHFPFAFNP